MLRMNRFILPLICLPSLVFGFPNSPEYIPNSDSCSAIKIDLECAWKGLPELANLAAESLISWASSSGCDDTELVDDAMKRIFNVDRSIMSKGEVKEIYGTIGAFMLGINRLPQAQAPLLACDWKWLQNKHDEKTSDQVSKEMGLDRDKEIALWDDIEKAWVSLPAHFNQSKSDVLASTYHGERDIIVVSGFRGKNRAVLREGNNQPTRLVNSPRKSTLQFGIEWLLATLTAALFHEFTHLESVGASEDQLLKDGKTVAYSWSEIKKLALEKEKDDVTELPKSVVNAQSLTAFVLVLWLQLKGQFRFDYDTGMFVPPSSKEKPKSPKRDSIDDALKSNKPPIPTKPDCLKVKKLKT